MDHKKVAAEVLELVGGPDNVASAAHCATRLRLVIADDSKVNKQALEDVDGAKGVFQAQGQLQIIFGTGTVNKVFAEFEPLVGAGVVGSKEDVKKAAAEHLPIWKQMIKTIGDIFVPIIPAIVASGLLMGLLNGLVLAFPQLENDGFFVLLNIFSSAAFTFLPILIAISTARVFGGNIFLGAVIGMIMISPNLINAWDVANMLPSDVPTASAWFGLYNIRLVGYQGHVIPVVLAVWFMSVLEKWLHAHVPDMIDLFVTPLTTVLVTGYLTLTIIGPIFSVAENLVLNFFTMLVAIPYGIGAFIMGGLYPWTVVLGIHHMYNVIETGMISANGMSTWMPIASAANVAQGGACLAVALKTRNKKLKEMALPASLSSFLGITEPAIFGVNLRFLKPMIAGSIGGACGAAVSSILHVYATALGVTGLFGFLITTQSFFGYLVTLLVATGVAFGIEWVIGIDDPDKGTSESSKKEEVPEAEEVVVAADGPVTIYAPLKGEVIPLQEIPDETFAAGILGNGVGIKPSENVVHAPFDGEVIQLIDTGHAVGIRSNDGVEMLIHVGIDTVNMQGKGFKVKVKEGDHVKKGDDLIEFDQSAIKAAGYPDTTAVLVINSDQFDNFDVKKTGDITKGEELIVVS